MVRPIDDGWLHLDDGTDELYLQCEEIEWDFIDKPIIEHYEGPTNIGVGGANIRYLRVSAKGIFVTTLAKYEDLVKYLLAWNLAGTFNLKVSYDGTNYIELDGDNETYPVMMPNGISKAKKISMGSIYGAVSNLNLYCDHIYIRSDFSNRKVCLKCNDNYHYENYEEKCLKCQKDLDVIKEYRYFCPYEGEDLEKEKRKLIAHMLRTGFKKQGLEVFEEQEIKHVQEIKEIKQEVVHNV